MNFDYFRYIPTSFSSIQLTFPHVGFLQTLLLSKTWRILKLWSTIEEDPHCGSTELFVVGWHSVFTDLDFQLLLTLCILGNWCLICCSLLLPKCSLPEKGCIGWNYCKVIQQTERIWDQGNKQHILDVSVYFLGGTLHCVGKQNCHQNKISFIFKLNHNCCQPVVNISCVYSCQHSWLDRQCESPHFPLPKQVLRWTILSSTILLVFFDNSRMGCF